MTLAFRAPTSPAGGIDRLAASTPSLVVPEPPLSGMVRFIRYGFMPNHLRDCGDENRLRFEHPWKTSPTSA